MYGRAPDCRARVVSIAIAYKYPPPGRGKRTAGRKVSSEQGKRNRTQAPYSLLTNRSNAPSERTTLSVSVQ